MPTPRSSSSACARTWFFRLRRCRPGRAAASPRPARRKCWFHAVQAIARGERYIGHDMAPKLSLQGILAHENWPDALTEREVEMLRLLAAGHSLPAISKLLRLNCKTVASYPVQHPAEARHREQRRGAAPRDRRRMGETQALRSSASASPPAFGKPLLSGSCRSPEPFSCSAREIGHHWVLATVGSWHPIRLLLLVRSRQQSALVAQLAYGRGDRALLLLAGQPEPAMDAKA